MGFFKKFLNKEEKPIAGQNLDEAPMPVPESHEEVPSAPAPMALNLTSPEKNIVDVPPVHEEVPAPPEHEMEHPEPNIPTPSGEEIYSTPSEDLTLPPLPGQQGEELPTFAQKFGTHPEGNETPAPPIDVSEQEKSVDEPFESIPSNMEDYEEDNPFKESTTEKHIEHIDKKIEEHLDDDFSFTGSKSVDEPKEEIKEELPEEELPEEEHPIQAELDKPLFVNIERCEGVWDIIADIGAIIRNSDQIDHSLKEIDRKSDSVYAKWKGTLEMINLNLFNINKKIFG